jgi:hypothetical protein
MKFQTIYILNDSSHDFHDILKMSKIEYDEIVFTTTGMIDLFNPDRLFNDLLPIVEAMNVELDAIIVNGPVLLGLMLGLALGKTSKTGISFLLYSPALKEYRIRRITNGLPTEDSEYVSSSKD